MSIVTTTLILIGTLGLIIWGTHFYFQSIDNTPSPIYDLAQTELPSNVPLQVVDPVTGMLKVQGWTKTPNLLSYNPSLSKTYWPVLSRNKQWNYFYIVNEDYLITMAHANVGLFKTAYVNILDIKKDFKMSEISVIDFLNKHVFIDVEKNGDGIYSLIDHPKLQMKFIRPEGDENTNISIHSHTDQMEFEGALTTIGQSEGITQVENGSEDGAYHNFNTKYIVDFIGEIKINGTTIMKCTEESTCFGLHDNGRSIGTYMNSWVWGTVAFRVKDKITNRENKVGINISLTQKPCISSGDALFIDGKIYKLDALIIKKISNNEWSIKSYKGNSIKYPKNEVDIIFKIANRHKTYQNYILIEVDFNSNFGYFSGNLKTADGHKIDFENQFGFVEEMFSRW